MGDDIETRQAKRRADVAASHAGKVVWCCSSNAEECFNDCEELFRTVAELRAALAEASRQLAIAYTILPTDTPRSAEARCIIQGPRDQVEAVARALCDYECRDAAKSGEPCCIDDPVRQSRDQECDDRIKLAISAIRVLTPMIVEQCAEIADAYATAARAYATGDQEATYVGAARAIASDIRSVKGAVT